MFFLGTSASAVIEISWQPQESHRDGAWPKSASSSNAGLRAALNTSRQLCFTQHVLMATFLRCRVFGRSNKAPRSGPTIYST